MTSTIDTDPAQISLRVRQLEGKVAIVTGAGSAGTGISNGRAISILLALHGARVGLLDRSRESAQETAELILAAGGEAIVVCADIADAVECSAGVRTVAEHFGSLQILVNNVGIEGPRGNAADLDPDDWDTAMQVNVKSMMLMAKYCIPWMRVAGGGSIVNIASVAGLRGGHPSLLYPTAKGAVVNMTRAMASHHGRDGIRVNCIAPGMLYTPRVALRGLSEGQRVQRRELAPLGTEGTGWDVAEAAVFLVGDTARWITGAILPVDAGLTAVLPSVGAH